MLTLLSTRDESHCNSMQLFRISSTKKQHDKQSNFSCAHSGYEWYIAISVIKCDYKNINRYIKKWIKYINDTQILSIITSEAHRQPDVMYFTCANKAI